MIIFLFLKYSKIVMYYLKQQLKINSEGILYDTLMVDTCQHKFV